MPRPRKSLPARLQQLVPTVGMRPMRSAEKVEHFVADGGSDVQLAGRELASGLHMSGPSPNHLSDVIVQDLPFLTVVSRDRSHAAQRLPGLNTVV